MCGFAPFAPFKAKVPPAARVRLPRMRSAIRFLCDRLSLAIVAIGTVLMLLVFVSVETNATHLGSFPLHFENNTDRVQVQASSTSGTLQTGDRIDLSQMTPEQRFKLLAAPSSASMALTVRRGAQRFPILLSATPPDYSRRATMARDIGIPLSFFLSLGLATVLFIIRPMPITLAFYCYTLLVLIKVNQSVLELARWPVNLGSDLLIQVVYPLTQITILIFAQRLYGRRGRAWPWFFGTSLVLAIVVFVIWVDPIVWLVFQRFQLPGPTRLMMSASDTLLLTSVICGLAYIASGATGLDRSRVAWVVAGIALSPMLDLLWAVSDTLSALIGDTSTPLLAVEAWADALQPWAAVIGSAFVLYGFLSQRVIDVRFAIGRAVLYGASTLILVVFFGIIEWWAEQIFESTRPAVYVSLAAALVIGFSMKSLHGRVEDILNRIFFREQRRAEEILRRAARALANTSSEKTLVEFLIDEPVRVLHLASSALFVATSDGTAFERRADRGWNTNETQRIDAEDPIIVALRADLGSIEFDEGRLESIVLPTGRKAPTLVIPLIMRGRVVGFVLYGSREDDVALTPPERALLEAIAASAAAAYDHIDADRSRERIVTLEDRLRGLGAAVPE
jgi:hypothetical protein